MKGADYFWEAEAMVMEFDDDMQAVLRTLRLARAQLQILRKQVAKNPNKEVEIGDMEVAIEMIIKKLSESHRK